ncbi:MAG: DUF4097 family beta strand repeat-containing protein [Actinomycetota bacterium]
MEPTTYDITGDLTVRMRLRSADVHIRETGSNTATVHVTGEREADEVSVEHTPSPAGSLLQIVQRRAFGTWGPRDDDLRIDVDVPAGTIAEVVTGSGDLSADGGLGKLSFQSGSGDAEVGTVSGPVRIKTASGDVRVDAVGGDASAATASGDIVLGSIGGSLSGRTASGDIDVGDLDGAAEIMSASGDIRIASARADVSLRSVSGDIEVGVPSGSRVWFDVSSTSGDTVTELAPGDDDGGDASFEIRASSVSGDIRIRRARPREASST